MASLQGNGWILGTKNWYIMVMTDVPGRYKLDKNTKKLLQHLDDVKARLMEEYELARMVRMSSENRKSLTATIRKVALLMQQQPGQATSCIQLIEMCTEILDIANRPPPPQAFPFMKLPREIRARIINMIIDEYGGVQQMELTLRNRKCTCANAEKHSWYVVSKAQRETFQQLGASLGDEFYNLLYAKRIWYFACCCALSNALEKSKMIFKYMRKAQIHWCGPKADIAFRKLATCPNLKHINIKISKATMMTLNKREAELDRYFPLARKFQRLMDMLGADELLAIRGLREVYVTQLEPKVAQVTEFDRMGLLAALEAKCKLPRA